MNQNDAINLGTYSSREPSPECRDSCLGFVGVEAFQYIADFSIHIIQGTGRIEVSSEDERLI